MRRIKKFKKHLGSDNIIDVKLEMCDNCIRGFAINLRCLIEGKWYEVYRVDTAHGYLHEQRYWVSDKSVPLNQHISMQNTFGYYMYMIKTNYKRYRQYYIENRMG